MKAIVGAFIMIAVGSFYVHFTQETPDEIKQSEQQAEANVNRLLAQLEDWKYARTFIIGDKLCYPVHDDRVTQHTE